MRFKTVETAKDFKEKFAECQEDVKNRKRNGDVPVERAVLKAEDDEEDEQDEEEEEYDEDDDDYDGGSDETIMFHQQVVLSQKDEKTGEVKMVLSRDGTQPFLLCFRQLDIARGGRHPHFV